MSRPRPGGILSPFAATRSVARKRYAAFAAEGVACASPRSALKGQALLGGEACIGQVAPRLQERTPVREVTKRQRLLQRPTLKQVSADTGTKTLRNVAMERAYRE